MSGIQGQVLEVTVVGCKRLKDTEWLSRQDPYVCLEYGSTKWRTKTHTDGGKEPIFQEKFSIYLIEGLTEMNVLVWNSNTLSHDDLIGQGRIQLQKVISKGYDDSSWSIQTKAGKNAGEVKLILHYPNANNKITSTSYHQPSAPPAPASAPNYTVPSYGAPPPYNAYQPTSPSHYPPAGYPGVYPQQPSYPGGYPQQPAYPPSMYPPAPDAYGAYPPPPGAYPTGHYYPPPGSYPPGPYPPY